MTTLVEPHERRGVGGVIRYHIQHMNDGNFEFQDDPCGMTALLNVTTGANRCSKDDSLPRVGAKHALTKKRPKDGCYRMSQTKRTMVLHSRYSLWGKEEHHR